MSGTMSTSDHSQHWTGALSGIGYTIGTLIGTGIYSTEGITPFERIRTLGGTAAIGAWTSVYDDEGQFTLAIDAKAQQTSFGHDRLGRLVAKVMPADLPLGNALRAGNAFTYGKGYTAGGFYNVGTRTIDRQLYSATTAYDAGSRTEIVDRRACRSAFPTRAKRTYTVVMTSNLSHRRFLDVDQHAAGGDPSNYGKSNRLST